MMSLIGAFYYLRVVKVVYFDDATDTSSGDNLTIGGDMKLVLGLNGLALLVLGVLPNGLYAACLEAMRQSLGGM